EELDRGSGLVDRLNLFPGQDKGPPASWPELWEPATFFHEYRNYLQIDVSANNEEDFSAWEGWVQSRLRHLVLKTETIVAIRAWPAKFKNPSQPGGPCRCFFYMGLRKHQAPTAGQVNLSRPVNEWRQLVANYEQRKEGMEIAVRHTRQFDLPGHCFPGEVNPHAQAAADGAGPASEDGAGPANGNANGDVQPHGDMAGPSTGKRAGTKRAAGDALASPDDKRQRSQDVPAVAEHPAAMDSTADQTAPSFSGRAGLAAEADMQDAAGPSSLEQAPPSQQVAAPGQHVNEARPSSPLSLEMQHSALSKPKARSLTLPFNGPELGNGISRGSAIKLCLVNATGMVEYLLAKTASNRMVGSEH
ncbi:hypothetical protein WJX84_010419, partial [Apatococcus fuscideae]